MLSTVKQYVLSIVKRYALSCKTNVKSCVQGHRRLSDLSIL
uniref:Uncharacterized protein n=1 Tax=Anguilla anguilla TaxID=7936 RepID=A0A0E9QGL9_ANGAN